MSLPRKPERDQSKPIQSMIVIQDDSSESEGDINSYTERRRRKMEKDISDLLLEDACRKEIQKRRVEKYGITDFSAEDDIKLIEKEVIKSETRIQERGNEVWNSLLRYLRARGLEVDPTCERIHFVVVNEYGMYQVRFIRVDIDKEDYYDYYADSSDSEDQEDAIGIKIKVYPTRFEVLDNDIMMKDKSISEIREMVYEWKQVFLRSDPIDTWKDNTFEVCTTIIRPVLFERLGYPVLEMIWRGQGASGCYGGIVISVMTFKEYELCTNPSRVKYKPMYVTYKGGDVYQILDQISDYKGQTERTRQNRINAEIQRRNAAIQARRDAEMRRRLFPNVNINNVGNRYPNNNNRRDNK